MFLEKLKCYSKVPPRMFLLHPIGRGKAKKKKGLNLMLVLKLYCKIFLALHAVLKSWGASSEHVKKSCRGSRGAFKSVFFRKSNEYEWRDESFFFFRGLHPMLYIPVKTTYLPLKKSTAILNKPSVPVTSTTPPTGTSKIFYPLVEDTPSFDFFKNYFVED